MTANEGIRATEATSCQLCGSKGVALYEGLRDRLFDAPGIWNFYQCPRCGLVWLNPRPLEADLHRLYEDYFTHDSCARNLRASKVKAAIRNAVLASSMGYSRPSNGHPRRAIGRLFSSFRPIRELVEASVMGIEGPPRGKLLDVGCGNGEFLVKMQALGWGVQGVEPDARAASLARQRVRAEIHEGTLSTANYAPESFDVITLGHVIEHVGEPVATLRECKRILRAAGSIFILTPNFVGSGHRRFGEAWFHLDPPRHLFLFSPQTLRTCVENAKLKVLAVRTISRLAYSTWVASRAIQRKGKLPRGILPRIGIRIRLAALAFHVRESGVRPSQEKGEEILMVARKSEEV